ncbi:MAG: hypothetical protein HN952_06440 [Candidatus Cloacimonetes bacterium]|jgi:hypothetical protein|nr:hypothetical protein [Candidatus Cloacimonadota bacterium]MBT6994573.1 hypothetical protein [Candidatus Cloacimonadota bacterium]MBT7469173.1 hypothetical protein [Candidatus Cloacimonadota bacterium]
MKQLSFLLLILLLSCTPKIAPEYSVELPKTETVVLSPFATFDFAEIDESSAIVKSRVWENVYWTLNDSGGKNRIFPFNENGEILRAKWYDENEGGVYIDDAVNIDWEEMATDNNGNLYIGACGNNDNLRRDLAIYILKDPFPTSTGKTRTFQTINFHYPEQTTFPATPNNFDSEAIFWAKDNLYLLTKHRADTKTVLYKFAQMNPLENNPLTKMASFDIGGMVTAADASPNGEKLAILTYNAVWLFENENDDYFKGKISWLPIYAKQCEAICFDADTLVITNEQMEIFRLPIDSLIKIK